MSWTEFKQLLGGLGPETVLGRVVAIRSEDDKEILKRFTRDQHRIRNEWRRQQAAKVKKEDADRFIESMKQALIRMAGGSAGRTERM